MDFETFDFELDRESDVHNWKNEWKDMPEFVQDKKEPYAKLIIRFDSEDDLQDFAKLIGQKLTNKTKSIWHPFKSHWGDGIKKAFVVD